MHFVRGVSAKNITEAWDGGFANNAKTNLPALRERIAMLNRWMTDMKSGQQMVFAFTPGVGLSGHSERGG